MPRLLITDEYWMKLRPIMLDAGIYDKAELRNTIEGILFRLRTGSPWRDLPVDFGKWNTIYKKFNEWSSKGKLHLIFRNLSKDPDLEWSFIDSSFSKAHQHSTGAASGTETAIGKSVSGNTTKIHMAVDSYGLPVEFDLTGGQVHDSKAAPGLIDKLKNFSHIIADRGYDCEYLRSQIKDMNSIPIIPRKLNSKVGNNDVDWCLYKYRHLVENIFARLKHFRAIATRYDKLKRNFSGMLAIACSYIWLPL
jgi:transposase